jgi:hypothetical protein
VLKNLKSSVDARVSVLHSATILANALVHAGTSVDTFLRENLEWLSRATNWAKFSATAGLGVIHRGQLAQGEPRQGAAVRAGLAPGGHNRWLGNQPAYASAGRTPAQALRCRHPPCRQGAAGPLPPA